jgi:phosphohistidine phosphatase
VKLYFLRHGIAEDHSPTGRDADRRLTDEGVREMQAAAAGMAALGLRLDRILSSPKARARHTAEIAAERLGLQEALSLETILGHGFSHFDLATLLANEAAGARILLVGHQPDLSTVIGSLIGGGNVQMKKASLAFLECYRIEPGGAELRWLLHASHLVRLGDETTPNR